MISPPAQEVLDELNDIVGLDGAELRLRSAGARLELELDLTNSTCPECVLPRALLLEILTARLCEADPDVIEVRLSDPRDSVPALGAEA